MKCYPNNEGGETVQELFSLLGFDTISQSEEKISYV